MNVAFTEWATDMGTTHGPAPVQSPDQPVKVEFESGVAVSVTVVPET